MRPALFLIFASLFSIAQARMPEEVVRAYFDAMRNSDDAAVARLLHPDDLREFRETHEPSIRNALRSAGNRIGFSGFVDPYDPKKVRAFTDEEFMAAFIRWGEQWQGQSLAYLKKADVRVIGHVPDGELQHVVAEMTLAREGSEIRQRIVVTTKNFEGEPFLVVTPDIKNLTGALAPLAR